MRYDEIWSYESGQIRRFFEETGASYSGGVLRLPGCAVIIEALEDRKVGNLFLPQTHVVIEGERADEVYRGFYMRFLKGGA